MTDDNLPRTLIEAVTYYSDPKTCFEEMLSVKWPDGKIVCPKCGGDKVGVIRTRQMLQCKAQQACGKQFSVKVGTIFEDSPIPLWKWLVAVWSVANSKNGISSCELARALGVTQKTAWFMGHRIRLAMRTKSFRKMSGEERRRVYGADLMSKKPEGADAATSLLRKLVQVPKRELDREVAKYKKRAAKRKKRS